MKLYEPIDTPKPLGENLWVVDGPIVRMSFGVLGAMPFPTRMVVARLADGTLWVWSPIALSQGLRETVNALGRVAHLVSPNRIHYAHIAAWKEAYPSAIAWASPGVRERARSQKIAVAFDRDLEDDAPAEWASEIDQLIFHGSRFMDEVEFFHRHTRTLIVADVVENFETDKLTFGERVVTRLGGVRDPDGKMSGDFRATFLGRRDIARRSFARMLAWKPERMTIAHGRLYERDAEKELRRAFRWLD